MPSRFRIVACAAVVCTLLAGALGCNGTFKSPSEKLKLQATKFSDNVRWGRYQEASSNLPRERRAGWVSAMESAGRVFRILDYDVRPVKIGSDEATVDVVLSVVRYPEMVVRKQRRRQVWQSSGGGGWVLRSDVEYDPEVHGEPPEEFPDLIAPQPTSPGEAPAAAEGS